jgi:hypothetical protein
VIKPHDSYHIHGRSRDYEHARSYDKHAFENERRNSFDRGHPTSMRSDDAEEELADDSLDDDELYDQLLRKFTGRGLHERTTAGEHAGEQVERESMEAEVGGVAANGDGDGNVNVDDDTDKVLNGDGSADASNDAGEALNGNGNEGIDVDDDAGEVSNEGHGENIDKDHRGDVKRDDETDEEELYR